MKDDWEVREKGGKGRGSYGDGRGELCLRGVGSVLPLGGRLDSHWKKWEKMQRLPAFPQAIGPGVFSNLPLS